MLRKQNYSYLNNEEILKTDNVNSIIKTQDTNNSSRFLTKDDIKIVMEHDMKDTEIFNLIGCSLGTIYSRNQYAFIIRYMKLVLNVV